MFEQLNAIPPIPRDTARSARAIFGRSNFYILVGEHLESILEDIQLQCSLERPGISKMAGAFLPLITFFQFVEGLTDVQAIDAVRTRTDWKFALHLPLIPAMFHEKTLCEFRQRMLIDSFSQHEFHRLIDRLVEIAPTLHNKFQNFKNLELVSCVCSANRLDRAQQAMYQALEVLAVRSPDWLRRIALPHWYGRYNHIAARSDLAASLGQQQFSMEEISADIHHLLEEIHRSGSREISELHEVKVLDQVWLQQLQTLDKTLNNVPEILNSNDCDRCAHKGAERRTQR